MKGTYDARIETLLMQAEEKETRVGAYLKVVIENEILITQENADLRIRLTKAWLQARSSVAKTVDCSAAAADGTQQSHAPTGQHSRRHRRAKKKPVEPLSTYGRPLDCPW